MVDVLVIGSVNLDLSASVARLPEPGETVTGAQLRRFPGGKGANQALAARRLGANVRLVASVGNDSAADEALALLRDGGVDLAGVRVLDNKPTCQTEKDYSQHQSIMGDAVVEDWRLNRIYNGCQNKTLL